MNKEKIAQKYQANREKFVRRAQKRYEENREKILLQQRKKKHCELCERDVRSDGYADHLKTKKHREHVKNWIEKEGRWLAEQKRQIEIDTLQLQDDENLISLLPTNK